jgi:hypothetical protein
MIAEGTEAGTGRTRPYSALGVPHRAPHTGVPHWGAQVRDGHVDQEDRRQLAGALCLLSAP